MLADMTIQRMDNVAIVVEDLDAAVAFFTELGMEREGKAEIEGLWADRTVGLDSVRSDIAMMRTPDGHSKLELTKYHTPARGAIINWMVRETESSANLLNTDPYLRKPSTKPGTKSKVQIIAP
jgi:hypothetical protein